MPTFLFDKIIFGPVKSRRLGNSLGINLLPTEYKFCNFDCIYCECGYTLKNRYTKHPFHPRELVRDRLSQTLTNKKRKKQKIDYITFAGNGEPTVHPEFEEIINDTIQLRDKHHPQAKIAVLSNALLAGKKSVKKALLKVDDNILKLDSGITETIMQINRPAAGFKLEKLKETLCSYEGNLIIQTMFVRGLHQGKPVDNTSPEEIEAWLKLIKIIKPRKVMIYTIARDTPEPGLEKIPEKKLNEIAGLLKQTGIKTEVSA